jgi:integrase
MRPTAVLDHSQARRDITITSCDVGLGHSMVVNVAPRLRFDVGFYVCVIDARWREYWRTTGVHRLRHTFCSHLAMRGAPARAIQELAGHQDLTTTQRYMHLSPAALDSAIRLLDGPGVPRSFGDMLETADR